MSEPDSYLPCMPETNVTCPFREEYTEVERGDWNDWFEGNLEKSLARIDGLTEAIGTTQTRCFNCPCLGGKAQVTRTFKRAYVSCSCDIGELQINIGHSGSWPKLSEAL